MLVFILSFPFFKLLRFLSMLGLYCSSWKTHFLPQRASADGVIEFDGGFAEGTQIPIFDVADTGTTTNLSICIRWLICAFLLSSN